MKALSSSPEQVGRVREAVQAGLLETPRDDGRAKLLPLLSGDRSCFLMSRGQRIWVGLGGAVYLPVIVCGLPLVKVTRFFKENPASVRF